MDEIIFSDGLNRRPDEMVYVALPTDDPSQVFNEELWNYMRKGPDKPTLIRVKAADVKVGETIYDLDGTVLGERIA